MIATINELEHASDPAITTHSRGYNAAQATSTNAHAEYSVTNQPSRSDFVIARSEPKLPANNNNTHAAEYAAAIFRTRRGET